MLEGYVGAEAWREGVRSYMKKHAYGNTVSDDLWREIQAAAGKPVLDIAHDFTLQPGVPLIRVESASCANDTTTLTLAQGEFTKDRPDKQALAWRVPVIASVIGTGADARTVVSGGKGTLDVPGCGPVVVNAGQTGYYRTLYAPAQFAEVRNGFAKLEAIDQLGLLNDVWALGMSGLQPASDYLDLAAATPVEADPKIWGEIAGSFASLDAYYAGDAARRAKFRTFAIAKLAPVFARIGWNAQAGEADPVTILRSDLIGTLGQLGDPAVIAEARRRYAAQATDPAAMPTALRRTILAVVALHADAATWEQMHAAAKVEKTPLVKDMLYSLLSIAKDKALAQRALELALTDEPGATNSAGMIGTVAGQHPDLAFDFAMAHRAQVETKVDSSSRSRYFPGWATARWIRRWSARSARTPMRTSRQARAGRRRRRSPTSCIAARCVASGCRRWMRGWRRTAGKAAPSPGSRSCPSPVGERVAATSSHGRPAAARCVQPRGCEPAILREINAH